MRAKEKPPRVGAGVQAFCRKCKADTLHKVTAVKQGKIKKATCTRCMSVHEYCAPKGSKSVAAPATPARLRQPVRRAAKDWATLVAKIDMKNAPTYRLSGDYTNAEALQHKIFGIGVITRVISPDKIEVVFKKKTTILAQNLK